ncbi:sensor histidine kinase [Streptomonospora wellingtoniae]|uniref:histidine kinase n=1 Tax=Streptomonospora wellingtoniae TaxID=3075544 RepID=A0ABU2KUS7_9ACTN|nr:HAMP domain-containing sensor histidine kinase [Streptomonospora sp. DSM 45055]MDT0303050.1 HAMP domain-containing sensor histidine kinase [Streptomonospora sp. DSM 45055]
MSLRSRRPVPRALGARLSLVVVCLTTVCLVVFGGAGATLLHRHLLNEVDTRLHTILDGPQGGAPPHERGGGEGAGEGRGDGRGGGPPPPFPTDLRTLTVDADGDVASVVGQTGSDASLPDLGGVGVERMRDLAGRPFTVPGESGGGRWRVVTESGEDGKVRVAAQSLAGVDGTVTQLLAIEAGVGAALLGLLGFAAVATVRLGLRPLHAIESTAQAIAAGDLDRRIPDQDPATETGRLGAALNVMLSGLARAVRERDRSVAVTQRFVADASHELRTPLSSIRGFAELYRQGRDRGVVAEDAKADRWMSRIEDEAGRMAGLVDDLLLLARFDEAPLLDRTGVELGEIAEQVAAGVRARAPQTPVEVAAPSAVHTVGDADRLRQVLENLVGNAVEHTPPGTPVRISVGAAAAAQPRTAASIGELPADMAEAAVVEVRDEGPGIPAEQLAHVFDRFYRVDESRSRGGAGLGLPISAAFVAAHDGVIGVDSQPGRGTVFSVVLPVQ